MEVENVTGPTISVHSHCGGSDVRGYVEIWDPEIL